VLGQGDLYWSSGGLTTSSIFSRGSELPQVPLHGAVFGGRWGKEGRLDN